jgi:phosphatidylethanolamine/phosphatidyl-N-methylethanolamine N-methyltransferase
MSQFGLFFREFIRNYHTTGAIAPSGCFLAKTLARYVAEPSKSPRRILEVGPGTGAVTKHIVAAMQTNDKLDLVELNDSFVRSLNELFKTDPRFQLAADRTQVLHCPIEELPGNVKYDLIVSGLPLNNFSADLVEHNLNILLGFLTPGGTLSFFEYIAIRRVKTVVSGRFERQRLRGINNVMQDVFARHEVRRDAVLRNIPPAWVHHLRAEA